MTPPPIPALARSLGLVLLSLALFGSAGCSRDSKAAKTVAARPALTVSAITPRMETWRQHIQASGNVAPWQEAVIGSEIGGVRLDEVLVNVGDVVQKGQVLARFSDETVRNDVAQQEAALKEAQAVLAQANLNIERARALAPTGSISRQDIVGYETTAATSAARLASAKVTLAAQHLRLGYTRVLAPDSGTISSRTATVGAVLGVGSEMFRLIRKNRLEWRGEMRAEDMARAKPGQLVEFHNPEGVAVQGKVRQVGPTVEPTTRLGLVYVDLPPQSGFHAGMFITGHLVLSSTSAMVLPQAAVIDRDGQYYAFRIGPDSHVTKVKLTVGRRQAQAVEVLGGLDAAERVVASGGSFLNDGDLVRVVDNVPEPAPAAKRK